MWNALAPLVEVVGAEVALWAVEGVAVLGLLYAGHKITKLLTKGS